MHAKSQRTPAESIDDAVLQLAHIFADGVLRLHRRGELPLGPNGLSIETALKTASQDLALPRDSRLSVTRG
jgi:hypothetical protein